MNKVLYFEVLVICFILLCHVLISVNKKNIDDNVLLSLKRLIVAVLVMLVFNFICEYVQGDNNPFIMSLSEILFFTGSCFVSYLGYLHIKFIVNEKSKNTFLQIILLLPIIFIFLLSLVSIKNGWIFTIDNNCHIQHGSYYFIISILMLICPVICLLKVMYASKTRKKFNYRFNINTLVMFCFFLLIATLVNLKYNEMPIVWPLASVFLLIYYIDLQEYSILNDSLTGINNRLSFNYHLLDYEASKKNFYLMIIDIDNFKQINDIYGHAEGDKAIKKTAELLKSVVSKNSIFLSRYGGDEFTLIGEEKTILSSLKLKASILLEFEKYNIKNNKDYKLKLSIGVADYKKDGNSSLKKLFEVADQRMYEEKSSHKKSAS